MQKANPIIRRRTGWGYSNGKARSLRGWAAICPTCSETLAGAHTRKQAKDSLYRHAQKKHEPGPVGPR